MLFPEDRGRAHYSHQLNLSLERRSALCVEQRYQGHVASSCQSRRPRRLRLVKCDDRISGHTLARYVLQRYCPSIDVVSLSDDTRAEIWAFAIATLTKSVCVSTLDETTVADASKGTT